MCKNLLLRTKIAHLKKIVTASSTSNNISVDVVMLESVPVDHGSSKLYDEGV